MRKCVDSSPEPKAINGKIVEPKGLSLFDDPASFFDRCRAFEVPRDSPRLRDIESRKVAELSIAVCSR